MKHKPKAGRQFVNFARADDFKCILLGRLGFSTAYVMSQTGLTFCQVLYRLKKAETKRASYRNGESAEARAIVGYAQSELKHKIEHQLRVHHEKKVVQFRKAS